jgi:hypothetical protein
VTWGELWKAERLLSEVAMFIEELLFPNRGSPLVPKLETELLRYLDTPLCRTENIKLLEDEWNSYASAVETWRNWDWSHLVSTKND